MKDIGSHHTRNLRRDKLLSDKERERLENRENKSRLAINDARVRKKLSNWLRTLDEVSLIFNHLPEEQSRNVVTNKDVLALICLSARSMELKEFYPVVGEVNDPYTWEADLDKCKPLNFEKCNTELFRAKFGNWVTPRFEGLVKLNKQIVTILRTGAEININGLLKGLQIDPNDSEAAEIIKRQIKILHDCGFVENTANGWQWINPPDSKQEEA